MISTFSHDLNNSFFLWLDNFLCKKLQAHQTFTTKFYHYEDSSLGGGKVTYGSPYKQWVYDHDIPSVTIPTGLTIDGSFVPTGTSGMQFDFDNGRVIFDSGVSSTLDVSGTYTVKNFNLYITDKTEETLISENKYIANSRFTITESSIAPYKSSTPAIFISAEQIKNNPYALGGEDETVVNMKGVLFAENLFQLDGVLSICADAEERCLNLLPMTKHPLSEFRGLKTGLYPTGYNYLNASETYKENNKIFIDGVNTAKMRDSIAKEINPNINIGFIDFELKTTRFPRS